MKHAMDTFTGIRPTADLTVANYIGAIQPLLEREKIGDSSSVFLAELHAATTTPPQEVIQHSLQLVRTLIASGINGEIFSQRDVKDLVSQAEVSIRGLTTVARLLRLPTLKEKVVHSDNVENANLALALYPVTMAADIILARPGEVPTGKDQQPHLEITKELIRAFNRTYGAELPEPMTRLEEPRHVLSLDNSGRKMSKTHPSGAIFLSDDENTARRKVMKSTTASEKGPALTRAVDNLALLGVRLSVNAERTIEIERLGEEVKEGKPLTKQFKEQVADNVVEFLTDFNERRTSVDDIQAKERLAKGHGWFRPIAEDTLAYMDEAQWS
jgi:tryptophanyl-tRNA synthetase